MSSGVPSTDNVLGIFSSTIDDSPTRVDAIFRRSQNRFSSFFVRLKFVLLFGRWRGKLHCGSEKWVDMSIETKTFNRERALATSKTKYLLLLSKSIKTDKIISEANRLLHTQND